MLIRIFVIIIIFLNFAASNKSNENEYVFDFSFDKRVGSRRELSIDVFKSTKNDAIILTKAQEKYISLEWISIGDPQLYHNDYRVFKPMALGFNMEIHMLSNEDKRLIKNRLFEIYQIEININQIKRQKLGNMDCTIEFEDTADAYTLRGTVQDFNRNPLEVRFDYKLVSEEYSAFWNYLNRKNMEDLRVLCQINSSINNYSKNIKIDIIRNLTEGLECEDKMQEIIEQPSNLENISHINNKLENMSVKFEHSLVNITRKINDLENNLKDFEIKIINYIDLIIKKIFKRINYIFYGEILKTLTDHSDWVQTLVVLKNGDLASGSKDHTIKIWNSSTGSLKRTLKGHNGYVETLAVLQNGDLASGSADKTIRIWNVETGEEKRKLASHRNWFLSLAVLLNGDLASGSEDSIKIWDSLTWELKRTLTGHRNYVRSLAVLQNGDLVSGSWDSTIKIWDSSTWELKRTLTGHTNRIGALEILPNGDLVSGSGDNTIKIWDSSTGLLKRTLTGHTYRIDYFGDLEILPNGDLASGSADNTIKIWNVEEGKEKRTLVGHKSFVRSLAVLPNGNLASGSEDKTIQIWY
jgi:WD40 repeat protein